jgi:hypothetical protein
MRLRWVGAKRGYWTTRASERPAQAKGMSPQLSANTVDHLLRPQSFIKYQSDTRHPSCICSSARSAKRCACGGWVQSGDTGPHGLARGRRRRRECHSWVLPPLDSNPLNSPRIPSTTYFALNLSSNINRILVITKAPRVAPQPAGR